jgi:hypothetical protein
MNYPYELYPLGTPANETIFAQRLILSTPIAKFWIIGTWVGFFLSLTAVITSYMYANQRKFPLAMSTWMVVIDTFRWGKEMTKFSNIAAVNEIMVWTPTPATCTFLFMWSTYAESATVITDITLATIIFITVVKRTDVSYDADPKYLKATIILFLSYTILYTTAIGVYVHESGGYQTFFSLCSPVGPNASMASCILAFLSLVYEVNIYCLSVNYCMF